MKKITFRTEGGFLALLGLMLVYANGASAGVPVPEVSAAPQGTHGFPYISAAQDLSEFGFIEEEFLISGTAQAYTNDGVFGTDGRWTATAIPGATANYTTRVLVRRPAKAHKFNGTVMVEWLNVSLGRDAGADDGLIRDEVLREGYVWVGVSAQYVGVRTMLAWESGPNDRYATLFHPGDSFSYDIFSQAAKALTDSRRVKPLGPLTKHVRELLATGHSQSGGRLVTYWNAVHRLAKVYDGILIHGTTGGAALSQSSAGGGDAPPASVPATPNVAIPANTWIRTDLREPTMFVNSETEVNGFRGAGVHLQPDSKSFRMWEIAGASHGDNVFLPAIDADGAKSGAPTGIVCENPPMNEGPQTWGMHAAIHNLRLWARYGLKPPTAPRVEATAPAPLVVSRDPTTGLALGGLRYPEVVVPTATLSGVRLPGSGGSGFCILFGATDPWNGDSDTWDGAVFDPFLGPEPDLGVLYPTHGMYVSKVIRSALDLVRRGYLRPADAVEIVTKAAHAPVPN